MVRLVRLPQLTLSATHRYTTAVGISTKHFTDITHYVAVLVAPHLVDSMLEGCLDEGK